MEDNRIIEATEFRFRETGNRAIVKSTDLNDTQGFFDVVDTVPSHIPKNFWDSRKIYVNGATKREYVYDYKNRAWYYSTLT